MKDLIFSPNTVFANTLVDCLDIFNYRLSNPKIDRVEISLGTQINGAPHIGTYLVIGFAFVLGMKIRARFNKDVLIKFVALENSPVDLIQTRDGVYQKCYGHSHPGSILIRELNRNYLTVFKTFKQITGTDFEFTTYGEQQETPEFRKSFLKVVSYGEDLASIISPSRKKFGIRIPCPKCGFAQKSAQSTDIINNSFDSVTIRSLCFEHGEYIVEVMKSGSDGVYLDTNTVLRNVIKEHTYVDKQNVCGVILKGRDWMPACQLVDMALGRMGITNVFTPVRFFTPQIVTETGAKLSKSAIQQHSEKFTRENLPEWIMDARILKMRFPDLYERIISIITLLMSDPRHTFRDYSYHEFIRLMEVCGGSGE